MTTPQSSPEDIDSLDGILDGWFMKSQYQLRAALLKWRDEAVAKAKIDPFDFVQPCEPECSPTRHAYHQGQWDMAGHINKHFGLPPHPNALTADKEEA